MDSQEWRTWLNESRAKQAQLQKQNYAMPSQGWTDPQTLGPMQGSFSVANPEGPTREAYRGLGGEPGWGGVYSQVNQHAPGYRPGIGSMTPEAQAAADRAWDEKQRMWDAEENARNAREDAAILRAGGKLPGTWDTIQQGSLPPSFSHYDTKSPESGYFDRAQPQVGVNQQADIEKYNKLMAQDNQNAANWNPTPAPSGFQSAGAMASTGSDYGIGEHIVNTIKNHFAHENEMGRRAWAGDLSPEVQEWATSKAMGLGMGAGFGGGPKFLTSQKPLGPAKPETLIGRPGPRSGFMDPSPMPPGWTRSGSMEVPLPPSKTYQAAPDFTTVGVPYGHNLPAQSPLNPLAFRPQPQFQGTPEAGYFQGIGPKTYPPADIVPYRSPTNATISPMDVLKNILYPATGKQIGKMNRTGTLDRGSVGSLVDWIKIQELLSMQRPNQGLR